MSFLIPPSDSSRSNFSITLFIDKLLLYNRGYMYIMPMWVSLVKRKIKKDSFFRYLF